MTALNVKWINSDICWKEVGLLTILCKKINSDVCWKEVGLLTILCKKHGFGILRAAWRVARPVIIDDVATADHFVKQSLKANF